MRTAALLLALPMLIAVSGCASAHQATSASTSPATSTAAAPPRSSSPVAPSSTPSSTAVTSPRPTRPAVVPATDRVTVRPVTAAGLPAAGYQVTTETETGSGFTCTAGALAGASPSAVSPDIRFCGSSASNTVACWKSAVASTVLCLRDPFGHVLVRITYSGTFAPVAAPPNPAPQGLVLTNGSHCQIRDGGAWGRVADHPGWVGWYECSHAVEVYGPQGSGGIDRSAPMWTVETVVDDGKVRQPNLLGPVTEHAVATAYYDGTA